MIPGKPRQARAVRAQTRRSVKIISGNQDAWRAAAIEVDRRDRISGFAVRAMIFADADKPMVPEIDCHVGITLAGFRRNRSRGLADSQTIQPLIDVVAEINRPL